MALSRFSAAVLGVLLFANPSWGMDYHVGPDAPYTAIGDVPWFRLAPGDTVFIHYKPTPYYEKFLISTRGTPEKWIRVVGVPGPRGELPVISGNNATTSRNMHYHWPAASGSSAIQNLGVVQVAAGAGENAPLPAYIEIANLQIQDGFSSSEFRAEDGSRATFDPFAACIYARSVQQLIVRDNVLTGCGQGFYNWTGSGEKWWDGLQVGTVIRGNYFYGNGAPGSYREHQSYTESRGVIYEYNRFGEMRDGARGSQLKDRSAGTIIRYNYIEGSPSGWMLDLVEPENGYAALGSTPAYRHTFVYGNVLLSAGAAVAPNMVHWNEDHQAGVGRAVEEGSALFFYHNTVVVLADQSRFREFHIFNTTWGGYDCSPAAPRGLVDIRNNIFAAIAATPGASPPRIKFAYCTHTNLAFEANWVSPGWTSGSSASVTGTSRLVSPRDNSPGFVSANDLRLRPGSSAAGIGSSLALEVTSNSLSESLVPSQQYVPHQQVMTRARSGAGSDAGAFEPAPQRPGVPLGR